MTELNCAIAEGLLKKGLIDKMPQLKLKHIYVERVKNVKKKPSTNNNKR